MTRHPAIAVCGKYVLDNKCSTVHNYVATVRQLVDNGLLLDEVSQCREDRGIMYYPTIALRNTQHVATPTNQH